MSERKKDDDEPLAISGAMKEDAQVEDDSPLAVSPSMKEDRESDDDRPLFGRGGE